MKTEPYVAQPIVAEPLIHNIDNPTLVAWFRCNSCITCLWREKVIDPDPKHDIYWCAGTHDRRRTVEMVKFLGYSEE